MIIPVSTSTHPYNIVLERRALKRANEHMNLDRKVLIVSDSGVPRQYSDTVAALCKAPVKVVFEQGEASKNLDTFKMLLEEMVKNDFTRSDCVVAVGGGVVGDLSGFAASAFMRGIDFYNIPTTVLSQVDSSIGGKTAVDFMGLKNIVGAFYPPKCVIVDPETLATLPERQISNGLAEALKMSMTSDSELFGIFENGDINANIDLIIEKSLRIKKYVVEQDEKESGLRKILNFGHTLAHAVESVNELENYYHGECVAIGMTAMCDSAVKARLIPILNKLKLPSKVDFDAESIIEACKHDKKMSGSDITVVYVPEIGSFELQKMPFEQFKEKIREAAL